LALVTGLSGLLIVYFLSTDKGIVNPVTMILAGVVLNIVASSIIGFTKYYFEESLSSIVYWLMGGFHLITPFKIIFVLAVFFLVYFLFAFKSEKLNLLALDDYSAQTSGINVKKERITAFVFSTLLVAVSVSYTGLIGFVGLIVPHIARSFFGSNMKNNLFYSSVLGAILLMLSDSVSRVIIPGGAELPVGIITAVLGGVFFLYILGMKKTSVWF
jgi:iron complex transport system permease protein